MNKKGKIAVEILIMLITVAVTSAVIFILIQSNVIKIKASNAEVSVLNAEFIPMGREGYLNIKDFKFCGYVDEKYNCVGEGEDFEQGSEVYFVFAVESSTYNGDVMLIENYGVKGIQGETLLEIEQNNNYHYDIKSDKSKETIYFKDYFTVSSELPAGEYTLNLFISKLNEIIYEKTRNSFRSRYERGKWGPDLQGNRRIVGRI